MTNWNKLAGLVLGLGMAVLPAMAQEAKKNEPPKPPLSPTQAVLEGWNDIGRRLVAMAEDFPEDKYEFKPVPAQRSHRDAATDRSPYLGGISVQVLGDLPTRRKSVGVRMRKRTVGKTHGPVGKLEPEAVPALASPAFGDAAAFEYAGHGIRARSNWRGLITFLTRSAGSLSHPSVSATICPG